MADARDPLGSLQRWITFTQAELQSLRADLHQEYQIVRSQQERLRQRQDEYESQQRCLQLQIEELRREVQEMQTNIQELNVSLVKVFQDSHNVTLNILRLQEEDTSTKQEVANIRTLVAEMLRDLRNMSQT